MLFTKIEGIPSYKLIIPLLRHLWLPKQYSWNKEEGVVVKKIITDTKVVSEKGKQIKKSQIASLAKNLNNEKR